MSTNGHIKVLYKDRFSTWYEEYLQEARKRDKRNYRKPVFIPRREENMTKERKKEITEYITTNWPLKVYECACCGAEYFDGESLSGAFICNRLLCQIWYVDQQKLMEKVN